MGQSCLFWLPTVEVHWPCCRSCIHSCRIRCAERFLYLTLRTLSVRQIDSWMNCKKIELSLLKLRSGYRFGETWWSFTTQNKQYVMTVFNQHVYTPALLLRNRAVTQVRQKALYSPLASFKIRINSRQVTQDSENCLTCFLKEEQTVHL